MSTNTRLIRTAALNDNRTLRQFLWELAADSNAGLFPYSRIRISRFGREFVVRYYAGGHIVW